MNFGNKDAAGAKSRNKTGTSDSDGLISKLTGMKSAVWIYFGFEADKERRPKVQDAMICWLCKKSVSAKWQHAHTSIL